jgi:hypothetical protein
MMFNFFHYAEAFGEDSDENLETLCQRYPMYDQEALRDILTQTDGDLAQAIQLLSII